MSTFPSILSSYTDPAPTNRLNSPSHSSIESAQNSGLSQLEAVIGVSGASSVVGSYEYIIKSPASDGGGHVQTANKGGTGQTSFNKGDILVATSSSVLSKLAVGSDGQILSANSSMASGINWVNNNRKLAVVSSVGTVGASATETSIVSFNTPASVLLAGNAIRTRVFINNVTFTDTLRVIGMVGTSSVFAASILGQTPDLPGYKGYIDMTTLATTDNTQRTITEFFVQRDRQTSQSSIQAVRVYQSNTSSVIGGSAQKIGFTAIWTNNGASAGNDFTTHGYTSEQIS